MKRDIPAWAFSLDYSEPCRVLERERSKGEQAIKARRRPILRVAGHELRLPLDAYQRRGADLGRQGTGRGRVVVESREGEGDRCEGGERRAVHGPLTPLPGPIGRIGPIGPIGLIRQTRPIRPIHRQGSRQDAGAPTGAPGREAATGRIAPAHRSEQDGATRRKRPRSRCSREGRSRRARSPRTRR